MTCKRFLSKPIEFPGLHVTFKLAIPSLPFKLKKPVPERGKFLRAEFLNLLFKGFDGSHGLSWRRHEFYSVTG